MKGSFAAALTTAVVALAGPVRPVVACPFCTAVAPPFAQQIGQSEAAVIARLIRPPSAESLLPRAGAPLPQAEFQVVDVLKGFEQLAENGLIGVEARPIEAIMLEERAVGSLFLLLATASEKRLLWASPIRLTDRAAAHVKKLARVPKEGPDRLAFFQQYLRDEDESLARDAYNEFAVAPYADVRGLKDRMDPEQLLSWIEDPKVTISDRRLYATMLGVCGTQAHADRIMAILEGKTPSGEQLPADRAGIRGGLDALVACAVALEGPEALDVVDRLFLDRTASFADTYAAVMALRFLGEESDLVPRERVLASLRLLLDEPKFAELVIADLARWQDWSVMGKLVAIFKNASRDTIFIREPIVNYLRACPLPEAAAAMKELERIDPEACRRAATLAGLAGAVAARPAVEPAAAPAIDDVAGPVDTPPDSGRVEEEPAASPSPATPRASMWGRLSWIVVAAGVVVACRVLRRWWYGGR